MITNPSLIRVVVADNNPVILNGLQAMLNNVPGISIAGTAFDFNSLQVMDTQSEPHIIIVDSRLPGIAAAGTLTDFCDASEAAIILYEHDITFQHAPFYIHKNVKGIVYKYQDFTILIESIRTILAHKTYYCPVTKQFFGNGHLQKILEGFDKRDLQVLQLIASQKTTKEIGKLIHYSPETIENIRSRLISKTNSRNIVGVILYAIRNKLITLDPPA